MRYMPPCQLPGYEAARLHRLPASLRPARVGLQLLVRHRPSAGQPSASAGTTRHPGGSSRRHGYSHVPACGECAIRDDLRRLPRAVRRPMGRQTRQSRTRARSVTDPRHFVRHQDKFEYAAPAGSRRRCRPRHVAHRGHRGRAARPERQRRRSRASRASRPSDEPAVARSPRSHWPPAPLARSSSCPRIVRSGQFLRVTPTRTPADAARGQRGAPTFLIVVPVLREAGILRQAVSALPGAWPAGTRPGHRRHHRPRGRGGAPARRRPMTRSRSPAS